MPPDGPDLASITNLRYRSLIILIDISQVKNAFCPFETIFCCQNGEMHKTLRVIIIQACTVKCLSNDNDAFWNNNRPKEDVLRLNSAGNLCTTFQVDYYTYQGEYVNEYKALDCFVYTYEKSVLQ